MKYKVGDKVKIKTWKVMEKEFSSTLDFIKCKSGFLKERDRLINKNFPDRILTITKLDHNTTTYFMKGFKNRWEYNWPEDVIECLVENHVKIIDIIETRFEILDL